MFEPLALVIARRHPRPYSRARYVTPCLGTGSGRALGGEGDVGTLLSRFTIRGSSSSFFFLSSFEEKRDEEGWAWIVARPLISTSPPAIADRDIGHSPSYPRLYSLRMERPLQQPIPTISRVHDETVVELLYDARARTTALVVGRHGEWTLESRVALKTGEMLVPYSPQNNLIAHSCVLFPSEPVDGGSKRVLLADIECYLHRYVDFSPLFERIAAHYVLLSWVYDAFDEVPYLRLKGEYGTGKTRGLLALGSIAYKGFFASAASTVSPIFHTLDRFGGTLILDEADLRLSDKTADLVKILNNGTVRGVPVLRTLQNPQKAFNPAAFTVYGPKVIAMRGGFDDDALESRFITEQMGVRPLREDIPIGLPKTLASEALALRNRLLHFRLTNLHSVRSDPLRLIDGIDPRLNQTAISLLSLIDDAALREEFVASLRVRNEELQHDRAQTLEARVRKALEMLAQRDGVFVSLSEITAQINRDDAGDYVSARDVGRVLRARSLPLYKSHGRVGLPKSALSALANPRNTESPGPQTAPLEHTATEGSSPT